MKAVHLIFCLVLFSLSNCNGKDIDSLGPAVIMGTIENHDPDDQLLYYTYLTGQPVKIINGQYKIELDIQEPNLISLKYNKMIPWDIYVKPGDSIHVAFVYQSPFAKAFQIAGIPRFILLRKDRRVLDSNAPRPSQEGVDQIFERGYPED
ncbi:MAG: hypothetical protein NXI25_20625 [bacterium]|nr:hypothetical protein [bacterium]